MSFAHIKEMLEMLCYYHNVEITHTFSKDKKPLLKVFCIENTEILQVTFIESQMTEEYKDVEEAASIIEKLINK